MFAVDVTTRGIDITEAREGAGFPGSEMLSSKPVSSDWTG
jgi:hypothetical protein